MHNLTLTMVRFFLMQSSDSSFFSTFLQKLYEGGIFFMVPILIMLLLILFLSWKVVITRERAGSSRKKIKRINDLGLLTLVWGILGQLIGLVTAFDTIEILEEISAAILADGLKISALPTIFGSIVFIVSKIITVIFSWTQDEFLEE